MAQFRKKPIVIEAFKVTPESIANVESWPDWLTKAWNTSFEQVGSVFPVSSVICVHTLEGSLTVSYGDWLIQGVKGELYPCKPDIFEATYEPV